MISSDQKINKDFLIKKKKKIRVPHLQPISIVPLIHFLIALFRLFLRPSYDLNLHAILHLQYYMRLNDINVLLSNDF